MVSNSTDLYRRIWAVICLNLPLSLSYEIRPCFCWIYTNLMSRPSLPWLTKPYQNDHRFPSNIDVFSIWNHCQKTKMLTCPTILSGMTLLKRLVCLLETKRYGTPSVWKIIYFFSLVPQGQGVCVRCQLGLNTPMTSWAPVDSQNIRTWSFWTVHIVYLLEWRSNRADKSRIQITYVGLNYLW